MSSHDTLCSTAELTIADGSSGNLPQHQAKGPNVHTLVRLKAVCLDGVVKHLRGHVALGTDFGVVADIQLISVLEMHNSQACEDREEEYAFKDSQESLQSPFRHWNGWNRCSECDTKCAKLTGC